MMNIRKAEERGRADYGWLNTHPVHLLMLFDLN